MQNPDEDKNYQYVLSNWPELVAQYRDKFVVVIDQKIAGFFDTYESAATFAIETAGERPFIVHHIVEPKPVNFVFAV